MHYIVLSNGKATKVDDEDYMRFMPSKWHLSNGYPSKHKKDGSGSKDYLHRLIMEPPQGMHVDHINGDKLDNRRCNLRIVTASQNHMNRRKSMWRNTTSPLKGAQFHKYSGKWRSRIKVDGRQISLGYYETAMQAHNAYIEAAKKHYGEYRFVG